MAKQTIKIRRKKYGKDTNYVMCTRCRGDGRVKKGGNSRKKK